ncbi:MAG: signal recognition particle receptor subunit beta [Verrucomicrobiales bacterium]|jgi:signal recognition particle receptor subunit beta
MALVNHDTREVQFKIVYCGPAYSGKTTNLQHIHERLGAEERGDLLSMATSTDRTVFFDYLPIDSVLIQDYHTRFQLYTVPGQAAYNATRQLVLRGVDAIVFVADSGPDRIEDNAQALRTVAENLEKNNPGSTLQDLPLVLQYNKRDVPGAIARDHLDMVLNGGPKQLQVFETVAAQGINVFATLNAVAQETIARFHAANRDVSAAPATSAPQTQPELAATA